MSPRLLEAVDRCVITWQVDLWNDSILFPHRSKACITYTIQYVVNMADTEREEFFFSILEKNKKKGGGNTEHGTRHTGTDSS